MMRALRRLTLCATCLLVTCWLALASEQEPTSPEPSIGLPTRERLISLLGSSDLYSGSEIADWLVDDLFPLEVVPAIKVAFHQTAESAAAEAVKPVLVELAGVTAEKAVVVRQLGTSRILVVVVGAGAFLLGWLLGRLVPG